MTQEHTLTPWEVRPRETIIRVGDMYASDGFTSYVDGFDIFGPDDRPIVGPHGIPALEGDGANASFIVTAVNAYASSQAEIARLRGALGKIASVLDVESYPENGSLESQLGKRARVALSEAKP